MEVVDDIEDPRDFVTIYKKDYLGKQDKRANKYKLLPKYLSSLNILNRPYKHYLNTRLENQSLSESERSEDPMDNLNRVNKHINLFIIMIVYQCNCILSKIQIRDKFPHLKHVLPEIVPDEKVIEREKKKSVKTIYQLDYSKEFEKGSLRIRNN